MFVSMKEMLTHAHQNHYAVMAVNCVNMEQVKACIESACEEHSPIIINVSPRQMHAHADPAVIAAMVRVLAETVDAPVALNLDHGVNFDDIMQTIRAGYSSIMIDASSYDFDENVRRTQTAVALAHAKGLSVEAELGHVGHAANGDNSKTDFYTNVAQAKAFVEQTRCDCLAVAIGTAHGSYPKGMVPKLDFERLKELKETLDMPLVLHGGSGAGHENIKKAVALGINKINVCTDLMNHATAAYRTILSSDPSIEYMELNMAVEDAMKSFIKDYMRVIGSSGQYVFEKHTGPAFD